jgi:ribosomal protection tetracycline resistance protein
LSQRTLNLGILAHVDAGKTTLTERLLFAAGVIAEVERVLSVLDGAILVISAVEGVQPQTRVLMRALRRLGIPVVLFVNKIDRPGASEGRVLKAITERVSPAAIPMGFTSQLGRPTAAFTPWDERDMAASEVGPRPGGAWCTRSSSARRLPGRACRT